MADLFDNITFALERQMSYSMQRQQLLSSNIANADTPKYQPKELSFQDQLNAVLDPQNNMNMKITSSGHTNAFEEAKMGKGQTLSQADGPARPDGNSVDLDTQLKKMSQNALTFQAASKLLMKKLATLKFAIQSNS